MRLLKKIMVLLSFPVLLASCEIFGLDFQEPYKYDYDSGIANRNMGMNTLDFIESRSDIFSLLYEAIVYAGVEENYKQSDVTYILPTNTAFNSTTAADLSYFQTHQLDYYDEILDEMVAYAPMNMTVYPKEQVREFLLYHTVKGKYNTDNMPAESTWYNSCAVADTAKVNLYILKDRNPNAVFNNFTGHYKATIKPRTANLISNEGAYIHVLDSWLDRPTKEQLNIK